MVRQRLIAPFLALPDDRRQPMVRGLVQCMALRSPQVLVKFGFESLPKLTYSTNNARFEEIETKASLKNSCHYGKRCIIPHCLVG